jgi:hypothetical protein
MKILFIADLSSDYILAKRLIREILIKEKGISFSIIDIFRGKILSHPDLFNQTIKLDTIKINRRRKIQIFKSIFYGILIILLHPRLDIIHIHYLNPFYRFFLPLLRIKAEKLIITLYGSDFYHLSDKTYRSINSLFKISTYITFHNPQMAHDFSVIYPSYIGKIRICRFGLGLLDEIDRLHNDRLKAKSILKLPVDNIIVCCGHSANRRELHHIIIKQLQGINENVKKCLFAVFPFTYNINSDLYNQVNKLMNDSGIRFKILDSHLSDKEVAALRIASDIMISVPSSDQMTASMLETLYAGGIVITGEWLPYDLLDENKIAYIRIKRHEELTRKIESLILSLVNGENPLETTQNKQIIKELFKWEVVLQDWINLYVG